jgi:benzylsuccinate CoA-transferase BbsF subunit
VTSRRLPLEGIRVVDFSVLAAGPLVAKFLADFGAEVIIVESEVQLATAGGSRQGGPPGMSPVNTAWFHNKFNTNKLSITIDLSKEMGRDVLRRLIAVSDVFIANRTLQVLEKLGLSYEAVREVRPDIVYLVMPTMGSGGPRHFYGGVSWGIQAMAGLNAISGFADRMPTSPSPYSTPDLTANPLQAQVAVLAALRHRRRTGRGQCIELSQYESTVGWMGPTILEYTATGRLPRRLGNYRHGAAPHDTYRCKGDDRWCAISVFTDEQWCALCEAIGRPELAHDPGYATVLARQAQPDRLRTLIEAWTMCRHPEEVMESLQSRGVPCAVLNNFEDLLRDAQLAERTLWTEVEHPELGTAIAEGWGIRLSRAGQARAQRAPLLGEHNLYVFQELLGMTDDEMDVYFVEDVFR